LSRCQIFDFNRIRVADGVDYMKHIAATEGVTYDEESLNLIARKADGGMRDALSMFDKAVSFCGSDLKYKEVATSLNILDYDTYFDAVDVVLRGDYGASLMLFDRVLSQGFSGQTFMAGLGSHLRDLLVAKNPGTAELLDVTGPLMERYKEQAARCKVDFLFDAIALLTDLDARIRVATNQRLMVELALMKLCNLASPEGAGSGAGAGTEAEKKKPSVSA
jgi:DNA polymerase-3 subunit gamma/tau